MRLNSFQAPFLLLVLITTLSARGSPLSDPAQEASIAGPEIESDDIAPGFFSNLFAEDEEKYEKRWIQHKKCLYDFQCEKTQYCSTKRHRCYQKLDYLHACTRSAACKTGYCGVNSHRCAKKKADGRKCFGTDSGCSSGYCSAFTSTCTQKGHKGDACKGPSGCRSGVCSSGKCASRHSQPPSPPHQSGTP